MEFPLKIRIIWLLCQRMWNVVVYLMYIRIDYIDTPTHTHEECKNQKRKYSSTYHHKLCAHYYSHTNTHFTHSIDNRNVNWVYVNIEYVCVCESEYASQFAVRKCALDCGCECGGAESVWIDSRHWDGTWKPIIFEYFWLLLGFTLLICVLIVHKFILTSLKMWSSSFSINL